MRTVRNPDCIIVGAGIFGMWAARRAIQAGKSVLVVEKRRVGAGASGGFLGALMPHMPDRWNAKKQFQFDALNTIGEAIAALEGDTGINCGFRRCGRLMPVRAEQTLAIVERRIEGARRNWPGYAMELFRHPSTASPAAGWPHEDEAPFGLVHDTLSARVNPRAYLAALAHYVGAAGELRENVAVTSIKADASTLVLSNGDELSAGEIVVAAGWEAYGLLAPFMQDMVEQDGPYANGLPGRGVKGQAVLLGHAHGDDMPILYDSGTYVVPHAGGLVAVGSTAVENWQEGPTPDPTAFDPDDVAFHDRACALAPQLLDAPVVERWANIRPRNMLKGVGTQPFMGKVPGHDHLTALIGGFRIGLAVAHMPVA